MPIDDESSKTIPPWLEFPSLPADRFHPSARQGLVEVWFDNVWNPFWSPLSKEDKAAYLDQWQAPDEWRKALDLFEWEPFDMEEDARESAEWLAKWRAQQPKPTWWQRIFKRGL